MNPSEANAYIVTLPMLVGLLLTIAGGLLLFFVKKWLADSDKAADAQSSSVHESFKVVHERIDKLRDAREADQKMVADLRVELAKAATKEELAELRNHIDRSTQELLKAVAARG